MWTQNGAYQGIVGIEIYEALGTPLDRWGTEPLSMVSPYILSAKSRGFRLFHPEDGGEIFL
jgi:hypothetical protein